MKTTVFGLAAALVIGLASFTAPASATESTPAGISQSTDVSAARYVTRRVIRRGPVCSVRKVVRVGPGGRRVVTSTRVCR